jgi:membrane dipeptidase
MVTRREVLIGAGLAGLHLAAGQAAEPPATKPTANPPAPAWPPYRDTFAIDGAAGFGFVYTMDDAAATAKELDVQRAAGLGAVLTTAAPQGRFWLDDDAFERAKKEVGKWQAIAQRHPGHLYIVRDGGDLSVERRGERTGIILGFQGTEPLGEDVGRVQLFRDLGVRVIQLTHNRRNLVGDGCTEPGNAGLSNYGHAVIATLNEKKVVVDLAHGAPRTISEGIAACKAPMLISHTGCRALADLPRNVHDAELRAMAQRGGVAGMIFWPYLRTDTQPMAVDVIRHIEHAIKVCGEDHVGIGTDIGVAPIERTPAFEKDNREFMKGMVEDGIFEKGRPADLYTFIPDLNMANRFEVLAGLLSRRGHSDARIAKILGGNFARVMSDVWG